MLDSKGFDLWADGYDAAVQISDDDDKYPFAGYKDVLAVIYADIMEKHPCNVLDIGIGTAVLAEQLYKNGNSITGVDFSQKMLAAAQEKMPEATLFCHDFTQSLPSKLNGQSFDFIVMTYSIHHLDDPQKLQLFDVLAKMLNPNGKIFIGDIAFETAKAQDACAVDAGDEWDGDEHYVVLEKLQPHLKKFDFAYHQVSHCAGILTLRIA